MKYLSTIFILATGLLLTQCTEEDEKLYPVQPLPTWTAMAEDFAQVTPAWTARQDDSATAPAWKADLTGSDNEPAWIDPDKAVYPSSMTAVVRLTPILEGYATDADRMAAFIGDECRGVGQAVVHEGVKLFFIQVKAPASETSNVEFRYYSSANSRIYKSVAADVAYEVDKVYGTAEAPEYPDFELSGKYPCAVTAHIAIDASALPFAVNAGDEVAAFVNDECRSICHIVDAAQLRYRFDVLGTQVGEEVHFKYYSADKKCVYVSEQTFTIEARGAEIGSADEPAQLTFVPAGSMTAYVILDAALAPYITEATDIVAAFASDVCIGVGEQVTTTADGMPVYKLVINGIVPNLDKVDVRYFNSRCSYVFYAKACITFADGTVVSSPDTPMPLPLDFTAKHPLTMTACVQLPADMYRYATPDDLLAAFVGNECRGVASVITLSDGSLGFKLRINGSLSNDEQVELKYYSTRRSYLYRSTTKIAFAADSEYGTEDAPREMTFSVVE